MCPRGMLCESDEGLTVWWEEQVKLGHKASVEPSSEKSSLLLSRTNINISHNTENKQVPATEAVFADSLLLAWHYVFGHSVLALRPVGVVHRRRGQTQGPEVVPLTPHPIRALVDATVGVPAESLMKGSLTGVWAALGGS